MEFLGEKLLGARVAKLVQTRLVAVILGNLL
jgi:hypothetical protein